MQSFEKCEQCHHTNATPSQLYGITQTWFLLIHLEPRWCLKNNTVTVQVTEGWLSPVSWEREMEWSCSGVITDALSAEGKLLLLHSTHILCLPKSIFTGIRCLASIHSGPCMYRNSLNTCSTQMTWLKPNGMDYIPLLQRLLLSALISHILLKRINRIGLPEFCSIFEGLTGLSLFVSLFSLPFH